ncbi:hypothetical protein [uncultured Mediterranean phage uvMED]|nr:hypothetical protein [uncultured Mediterranean phage uvMED]BAR22504.1 hypothetical protein [uncultured Mediterranean phage uvMED]
MSEYTLSNTATQIDSAITRVHNADAAPTVGSGNMVTSGGVKAAIDTLSQGGVSAASLGDSLDTVITSDATDSLIPTSKAVVDYIDVYGNTGDYAIFTKSAYEHTSAPTSYFNIPSVSMTSVGSAITRHPSIANVYVIKKGVYSFTASATMLRAYYGQAFFRAYASSGISGDNVGTGIGFNEEVKDTNSGNFNSARGFDFGSPRIGFVRQNAAFYLQLKSDGSGNPDITGLRVVLAKIA